MCRKGRSRARCSEYPRDCRAFAREVAEVERATFVVSGSVLRPGLRRALTAKVRARRNPRCEAGSWSDIVAIDDEISNRLVTNRNERSGRRSAGAASCEGRDRLAGERDDISHWVESAALRRLAAQASAELDDAVEELRLHERFVDRLGLREDERVREIVAELVAVVQHAAQTTQASEPGDAWRARARLRLLRQLLAILRTILQWGSPSYDQSVEVAFFDPSDQRYEGVNYARYGSRALHDLEVSLAEILNLGHAGVDVLATSSGMAAYHLIESFLIRDVLAPGDVVISAPSLYFEVAEQLESLSFLRIIRSESHDASELVRLAEATRAKVIFVDPMANVPGLAVVDFRELARLTRRGWADRWIVADGTMVSGGIPIHRWFAGDEHPRVLYYESASKYLQLGLDLQMAGLCAVPREDGPRFRKLRRNTGTTMYPFDVARFPRFGREEFLARMRVLTENAEALVAEIGGDRELQREIKLGYPARWRRLGWNHGGGVVTATFARPEKNTSDGIELAIECILREARAQNVRLTKGLSFGCAATRISAASANTEGIRPYLRFSLGEEPSDSQLHQRAAIRAGLRGFVGGDA